MKKVFKFLLFLILFIVIVVSSYFVYMKFFASKGSVDAFNTVPKESVFVVETTNLSEAWSSINRSEFWQNLVKNDYFGDINEDIKIINAFLDSNVVANTLFKGRKLIISAVMYSPKEWDFLFSVDLDKASASFKVIDNLIDKIKGYQVSNIKYKTKDKNYEIIKMTDLKNPKSSIFISYGDNVLLVSFNVAVIQKSLDGLNNNHWKKDKRYVEIMAANPGRKLFKIYINYKNLNDFAGTFLTKEDETISMLSSSLYYSVFDFSLTENMILLDGYANMDSVGTYIQALARVKPGRISSYEVMTNQTAAFVSISFDDYMSFYKNLMEEYRKSSPEDMQDVDKAMNLMKNLIKIDINRDLFSWIGNEIALYKIRPLSSLSRAEDIALVINAKNIDDAKAGMGHIVKQIRKWSPFKFKEYDYNGFEISFLKQKNFFKPFFGKIFEDIEEPYFTFIENNVIFSNSEEVLKQIIDDYNAGRIISNDKNFKDFIDEFEVKSNIAVFINMPKMYPTLYYYTPSGDRKDLKENEVLIKSFAFVGFQLVSKGKMFRTSLFAKYDSTAYSEDLTGLIEAQVSEVDYTKYLDTMGYLIKIPEKLSDGKYVEYFDDANKITKLEGNIVKAKADGMWRTYYESGNIKSTFTYENGRIEGVGFFYYDDTENTLRAEVIFKDDKLNGLYKEYHENGARKSNLTYEDGKKQGSVNYFYKTGVIQIEGTFSDNQKYGKWVYYDENGNKIATEKYKRGEKVR